MPNVAKVLKEEISRIGRKESSALARPLQRRIVQLVHSAADMKRRLALLEAANKQLQSRLARIEGAQPAPAAEQDSARGWISGKGVRSLRKSLGLSAAELGALVDVSAQSVYNWEANAGMLKLRDASKNALMSLRGIGAREARRRLAEKAPKRATVKRGKAK
ncbi:MAG: helix-turn-helix transcriptional regulator [Microthrixaceae bacterium]|nr:helix-turn-helix transcriptional regulator [Microthrixaceae bacterium]